MAPRQNLGVNVCIISHVFSWFVVVCPVVSDSAVDCMETLISAMTCHALSGTFNSAIHYSKLTSESKTV